MSFKYNQVAPIATQEDIIQGLPIFISPTLPPSIRPLASFGSVSLHLRLTCSLFKPSSCVLVHELSVLPAMPTIVRCCGRTEGWNPSCVERGSLRTGFSPASHTSPRAVCEVPVLYWILVSVSHLYCNIWINTSVWSHVAVFAVYQDTAVRIQHTGDVLLIV